MFCTKCGNEIKEGAKFCTKCGAPAEVIPAYTPTEAVYAPNDNTIKVNTKGINTACAVITAVLCGFALMQFFIGYVINRTFLNTAIHTGNATAILYLAIDLLILTAGVVTGILSRKLAVLSIVPFAILVLDNLINIVRYKAFYVENIIVSLLFISSLVILILAATGKGKPGVVFAGLSIGMFAILTAWMLFRNAQYYINSGWGDILYVLKDSISSFSYVYFYSSYIVLSIGLLIRNRKLKGR